MKIVHLTSAHPRYDTRIFIKMCVSLSACYETHLVVADGKGDEESRNVTIHDVGKKTGGRIRRMTRTVSKVMNAALALDADLYHLHDPELIPIGLRLKKRGKKVIFDAHEDLPLQILSKVYLNKYLATAISKIVALYEKYACRKLDAVVAATPYIREKFLKIQPKTIDVNNFPKLDEFSTLDSSNFLERKNCCYVGGITKVRGIEELVQALSFVTHPIKLNLAGTFSENKLENEIKAFPGWDNVNELGWLDRDGIQSVLQNSFVGIVTLHPIINYQDSLPVKMFEYMAAGIPVIYSNIPLWKSIIESEQCGISVDPYSPREIADNINLLYSNLSNAKLMGENGRKAVIEKYNWSIEERKLFKLYRDILA